MDQGRQGRDQVDTAVVQDVRGQRRAAPASCARLQSWQLSPHACDTGADQGLVADELEGEADPHLASVLLQGRKSANIHASSGVIWGMSGYTNFRGLEPAAA